VGSCGTADCFDHVSPVPLPAREDLLKVIQTARHVLFPGYFDQTSIEPVSLGYYLGQELTMLYHRLADQIVWAIRHDCYRYEQACSQCTEQGHEKAMAFIQSLPEIRRMLGADVRAAYEGDPASKSFDEIIFSYPGLFAITVYRMAHVLWELKVPLIPRIMSEYAHSQTGIDIHPGASIGRSFFIDTAPGGDRRDHPDRRAGEALSGRYAGRPVPAHGCGGETP
jgi:serine O-acetyltransferase